MTSYIVRKFFYSLLVIFGVVLLTFVLFNVAAGDPAAALLGKNPRPSEIERLRRALGSDLPLFYGTLCRTEAFAEVDSSHTVRPGAPLTLTATFAIDDPLRVRLKGEGAFEVGGVRLAPDASGCLEFSLPGGTKEWTLSGDGVVKQMRFFREQKSGWNSQFFRALGEIISFQRTFPYVRIFDFGRALASDEEIRILMWRGVWPSLLLMLPIFFGELFFGIVLALLSAAMRDSWVDRALVVLSVAGMSVSYLVMIIGAQFFLGYYWNLFPVWGFESGLSLILPVLVGIVSGLGGNVRFYRTVFLEELNREYLRTARSKGVAVWQLYARHLLGNALLPVITRAASALPFLFTGSLLLESFFGIPGLGYASIDALNNSDLQLLKALVILSAFLFVLMNLVSDLLSAWADPRIRLK